MHIKITISKVESRKRKLATRLVQNTCGRLPRDFHRSAADHFVHVYVHNLHILWHDMHNINVRLVESITAKGCMSDTIKMTME